MDKKHALPRTLRVKNAGIDSNLSGGAQNPRVVPTDRQEKLIDTLVDAGKYQNASEVLREGLRLVEQREAQDAAKLAALKELPSSASPVLRTARAGRFLMRRRCGAI